MKSFDLRENGQNYFVLISDIQVIQLNEVKFCVFSLLSV